MSIFISIIIPVYKVPQENLRICFNSLLAQMMQNCEFIVVSDGAPDEECSICEEYEKKDSRFKFFKREHAGVSAARNFGIKQAQGKYITFVDSDDQIDNMLCDSIYRKAEEWNSDIILFEHSYKKSSTNIFYSIYNTDIPEISFFERKHLIDEVCFAHKNYGLILCGICCKAYKKTFLDKNMLAFDTRFCYSEDQFFCLNALLKAKKISYLSTPLYQQNHRNNSASFSYKENYEKEVFCYLEAIKEISKQNNISPIITYNRAIQCILYTLDKCIFRPDPNLTYSKRKDLFNDFLNYQICSDSLSSFEKVKFKFSERVLCFLCKHRLFFLLLLISKKWHWDRKRQVQGNKI